MSNPALKIVNGELQDPSGNRVLLRGLSSQGMGMVYGDKANPGTYVPMSVGDYIGRAVQKDGQGQQWFSRALRLCFEAFPCVDPARLYSVSGQPYCAPELSDAQPWAPSSKVDVGVLRSSGGNVYQSILQFWAADRGQAWNLPAYAVGDVAVGLNTTHVYRCTSPALTLSTDWASGPSSLAADFVDGHGAHWTYIGEAGTTGITPPGGTGHVADGLAFWRYIGPVSTQAQKDAAWADWTSKVMDPATQATVDAGLYAVICHFDFGPAHHPLRAQRLHDFWARLSTSRWANHPQVLFELWNESEDIGSFAGGAGSWTLQKPVIQQTVDAIRAAGANNIIIVPTPFYSSCVGEATASPLTGSNIGYAWHQYASEWASPTNQQQIVAGLASGQAIFVTEFGDDSSPTDPTNTWLATLRKVCEPSQGAIHPSAGMFAWAETDSWSPSLFSDDKLTVPTVDGQAVRQWLADMQADSQPGGSLTTTPPPVPTVTTATPIIDSISVPVNPGDPVIVKGHLAPVVVVAPPVVTPPPPAPTPAQLAAAAILSSAQADLSAAQVKVAQAQLIVEALQ